MKIKKKYILIKTVIIIFYLVFLLFFLFLFTFNSYAKDIIPVEKPNIRVNKDGSVVFLKNNIVPHDKPQTQNNTKKIVKKDNKKANTKYVFSGVTTETTKKQNVVLDKDDKKLAEKTKEENKKTYVINNENFKKKDEVKKTYVMNSNNLDKKENKQNLIVVNNTLKETKNTEKTVETKKDIEPKKTIENKKATEEPIKAKEETPQPKEKKVIVINNDNFKKNEEKKEEPEQDYKLASNAIENDYAEAATILNNKVNYKPATKVVKSTNYSSATDNNMNIINKIEQNLLYGSSITRKNSNNNIEIKKGSWSNEDLKEVETKKKFEITKTSKNIDMMSKETEKNNKIASLKDEAYQAVKLKEYEIAIKLYKEILALNSKDNFTKLSLATTYHILGQYVQAKPLYIELLPVFPNSEQLISNLLSIIIQESPYEAIYLLPALAEKYSSSPVIQAQTSVAFSTVERYNDAIKYIKNAIYLDEGNIEYKYNLAVLYDATKQYEKAYKVYQDVATYIKNNQVNSISLKKVNERIKQINKLI